MHTYEREDPFIQQVLAVAREKKLDLSTHVTQANPWEIEVSELVNPDDVKKIAKSLAHGWPEKMPLPIVSSGVPLTVMDGSHRVTAARVRNLTSIPVIVLSWDTYDAMLEEFGLPFYDYIHSILPAIDPLMAANEKLDRAGGHPKVRTAQAWDMDAFL